MKKFALFGIGVLLFMNAAGTPKPVFEAQKTSIDGVSVIRLSDSNRGIEVTVLPSIGNIVCSMTIHGKNILFFPDMKLSEFQKKPMQTGIPFLAPWANRLDEDAFWANGKKYGFDLTLGNFRKDGHGLPIHGLLPASTIWDVEYVGADRQSASVTSKFEFWKQPDLMKQWPFAHGYEMTYRLADGALEVKTTVTNLSSAPMPLAIGFHPYYRIPDVPRDQWILHMPARTAVIADDRRIPTGEFKPVELPHPLPLKDRTLDDGFTDMERDANGKALFSLNSGDKQIDVLFGPQFPVAVIWEPALPAGQPQGFICIEPMTGITNAINLNHAGKYPGLQTVPAGGKWTESFWIRPKGL
jgi:aldose 1-epimerase